ncbi:MAG TPA: sigma factor, partial [Planctomycetaceae bacterium]|nr:sigma factor [Planctomycetaceae bacterium]
MARSSDQLELDRLVSEHLSAALRFATRLTGDVDAAEDVLQEALVRVARSWKTFRREAQFQT